MVAGDSSRSQERRDDSRVGRVPVKDDGVREHRLGESGGTGRQVDEFSRKRSQTCV